MKIIAVFRKPVSSGLLKMLGIYPDVDEIPYPTPEIVKVEVRLEYDPNNPGLSPAVYAVRGPLKGRNLVLFGPDIQIEC